MSDGFAIYSAIKRLLFTYNIEFKSNKDYENFFKELAKLLDV